MVKEWLVELTGLVVPVIDLLALIARRRKAGERPRVSKHPLLGNSGWEAPE